MLASVVIACHNHARFIRACLTSLHQQTYRDIELVILDDASTDTSFDILKGLTRQDGFHKRFQNIRLERNAVNLGASATWNRAIQRATGEVIFLLNSDDYFAPDRIATFAANVPTDRPCFAFSPVTPVADDGSLLSTATAMEFKYRPKRLVQSLSRPEWGLLDYNLTVSTGNFVFNRQLFDRLGGFSPLRYCHDWSFALRASTITQFIFMDTPSYFYRIHGTNSFHTLSSLAAREAEQCYRDYASFALDRPPLNRYCLSPHNQGPAFAQLIRHVPNFHSWVRAHYAPYDDHHRTVRPGPYTRYEASRLPF